MKVEHGNRKEHAFSNISRRRRALYGVEGMLSENHGGLYHLLRAPREDINRLEGKTKKKSNISTNSDCK